MRRALALARRGAGRVSPNPMVGAVVVKNDRRVGEGYHLFSKKDHAEVLALRSAGKEASGADLYLNLEPCSHHGRTPPCVDRILESGIRNVFVATLDPNPQVAGKGIRILQQAGINVEVGLCEKEATRLNEVFFHFITSGSPFVTLKSAMTLDGKIATKSGASKWITGDQSRRQGHRLRYESDAILTGVNTVLQDDPSLDVRWTRSNPITKIVLDTHLRTPPQARLFRSGDRVLIFHGAPAKNSRKKLFENRAILISVPVCEDGVQFGPILDELGKLSISSVLIEGGSRIAASAVKGGYVKRVCFFYGSKLIGGNGLSALGDLGVGSLNQSPYITDIRVRRLGDDFWVQGYFSVGC